MGDRTVSVTGGQRIAVIDRGKGPPVLFLHGIGSASDAVEAQVAALKGAYRCIAWDAPGYAESADPAAPPGMDGYADAAATVLVELGAAPAHVVGVSFGGVVAVRLALRHPHLVRSLVLADSTRGSGADPARAAAMRSRGDELERLGRARFAETRAPNLLSPGAPPSLVERVTAAMARAIRNPGYRWAAEAMADTDHLEALSRLDLPVLVVVGEHDAVTPVHASRELARALPGSRLEVVPGAGHLANQERPSLFNRLLLDFLARAEQARTPADAASRVEGGTTGR